MPARSRRHGPRRRRDLPRHVHRQARADDGELPGDDQDRVLRRRNTHGDLGGPRDRQARPGRGEGDDREHAPRAGREHARGGRDRPDDHRPAGVVRPRRDHEGHLQPADGRLRGLPAAEARGAAVGRAYGRRGGGQRRRRRRGRGGQEPGGGERHATGRGRRGSGGQRRRSGARRGRRRSGRHARRSGRPARRTGRHARGAPESAPPAESEPIKAFELLFSILREKLTALWQRLGRWLRSRS